jgi:DNA-binding beta-propeller fold protein YncE
MRKRLAVLLSITAVLALAILLGQRLRSVQAANDKGGPSIAAVPGSIGGQDMFGAYDVVPDWPKPLSTIPGNEKWTWGAGQSVFAESPNRVFILQRGELPNIERPKRIALPQLGPSIEFPIGRLPWRDATSASPPGRLETPDGKLGDDSDVGKNGVDFNWAHCIVVVDANGNHIEDWTQWDKMLRRPHSVYISPYDPEKRVWIVDDYRHAIFIFTNDGKKLLQTIGEPNVHASDDKHFYRPTFIAWLPDGTFFVGDGYANTRVVKFDKNGKYLTAWGEKGNPPNEKRPGYFNTVHGVAVDTPTRRVFVNDRQNHRVQVFDENGKYLKEWSFGPAPSDIHLIYIGADRMLWAFDRGTSKMLKYDLDGHFLYSWGTWGDFPGGFWGVHGIAVDQEGNFYAAAVDSGGVQKFRPRPGANPAFLIGKPIYSAWK